MSSTSRGGQRCEADFYETPEWVIARLLDVWRPAPNALMVEPAFGNGAIVEAVQKLVPGSTTFDWLGYDIRESAFESRENVIFQQHDFLSLAPQDFLSVDWSARILPNERSVKHVITNPPFSLAEEFLRQSRKLYPEADLVYLLRLNFLASKERLGLWRDLGVPDVHVLPNRPSFTGEGTDSCEYAWMVFRAWNESHLLRKPSEGILTILPETPKEIRKAWRETMARRRRDVQ